MLSFIDQVTGFIVTVFDALDSAPGRTVAGRPLAGRPDPVQCLSKHRPTEGFRIYT